MTTLTLLENGRLRTEEDNGRTTEIGREHPDYQRLAANYRASLRPTLRPRLTAIAFILAGSGRGGMSGANWSRRAPTA